MDFKDRIRFHVPADLLSEDVTHIEGVKLAKEVQSELRQYTQKFEAIPFSRYVLVRLPDSLYVVEDVAPSSEGRPGVHRKNPMKWVMVYFSHDQNIGVVKDRLSQWDEYQMGKRVPIYRSTNKAFEPIERPVLSVNEAMYELWHYENFKHPVKSQQPTLTQAETEFFNKQRNNVVDLATYRNKKADI